MRQARDLYVNNDVPALRQKGVEPPSPVVASKKTWVIWNCVHHARKHATSREPAWSEPELPARERYAGLVATAWQ